MDSIVTKFEHALERYSQEDRTKILEAARWAETLHKDQKRASGEPYIVHPFKVAELLVDLDMDYETVIAALLHDSIEDTDITRADVGQRFGKQVEALVDGVTKISILKAKNKSVQEAETIRKMLFAMTKDIRVILIKLADKLHNMQTLQFLPPQKVKAIATECLDIYAPLAGRLGISWMKAELEDLALKHLQPEVYKQIKAAVTQKREARKHYLDRVIGDIHRLAKQEGYDIEVTTRIKHFYSIYRKMKRRQKEIGEIFDLLGIRILCKTENECYGLLGLVHRLWPPIEGRFKDYIAMPKANKYQ
ncbi:MAG TPA: HD domain-containing protein, partial [Spirochaetia bacterium]|nr:HD domain-containing protein [Spirochaetia bacterium]